MTDPNESTSLKFIPSLVVNGVKCARIEATDVMPEIEYWKSAILCSVLGANPPLEVIKGFTRCIWKIYDINKICMARKGVFLVKFKHLNEQAAVVQRGVYFFDKKPLLVKPWNEEMDINTEDITSLPIRVKFPDLDIKYWGLDFLSKIEYIELVNEYKVVVRQRVEFEWKPTRFNHCKMFGHTEEDCRKKVATRIEWRPVNRQESQVQVQHSLHTDEEGFTTVMRRAATSLGGGKCSRNMVLRIKSKQNSRREVSESEDEDEEWRPSSPKRPKSTLKKKTGTAQKKMDASKPKKPPTAFFYFL
ncbi:hypothetical protein Cgig2_024197 [Carnegiea gigantea]|uniref:DUF4283 domain-containing protein n=1 Tax=Carnegiea gigantea TaxID=171969 RepID=A0A9Q1KH38_9CARY|nr:hypothetical protein Cgig2_024197 [Carnegiea gigantea]